jgi:hypothetical protein
MEETMIETTAREEVPTRILSVALTQDWEPSRRVAARHLPRMITIQARMPLLREQCIHNNRQINIIGRISRQLMDQTTLPRKLKNRTFNTLSTSKSNNIDHQRATFYIKEEAVTTSKIR